MNTPTEENFSEKMLVKAEQLKMAGEFEKAIELLQKLITEDPQFSEAYEELGDNFLSLRKIEKAKKCLLQALKINSNSANACYLLGFLYSLEQKWFHSVEMLERANELFPNNAEILRCLGWSLYNQNRKVQGLALLERSKILKPGDPNILCDLGICYMNNSDFPQAEETFQQVIQMAPDSDQANECRCFLDMMNKVHQ